MRPKQSHETPDRIRADLEDALLSLSQLLRVCPTLSADPKDPTRHSPESNSLDCAMELPNSHCAFSGCTWTGSTTYDLIKHVQHEHILALQDSMSVLRAKVGKAVGEDETILASVYSESIAMAIRKGAP